METTKKLLTVAKAAKRTRLSVQTVYNLIRAGKLPAVLVRGVVMVDPADFALPAVAERRKPGRPQSKEMTRLLANGIFDKLC